MTDVTGPGWLFCPADRPDRYAKAAAAADVVIIDLEDAVAAADKESAREALLSTRLDPATTVIRINGADTEHYAADLGAVHRTDYRSVMLPKAESPEQLRALDGFDVIALIESPRGALAAERIMVEPNAVGIMWGAEDLVAALGGQSTRRPDGSYRDLPRHLRSSTLLAGKAAGKFALDGVYLNIPDLDGLREEALDAVAVGFDAKVAIHPSQIPVIRGAYAPSPEDLDWARRVLAEVPNHRGVFQFEGRMVDGPVLRHAEQIVRRGGAASD
ncbi:HpcH/HpaI aldolase/citrate lyase family protein [Nocardia asteroides]|uniref:HpcH/HpaI aldolase/citrate lyase family protein n=1 Tax=Nocardia asteroides TaxID=1824 RepID=UPI001E3E57F9|nr:CoA ester lyase [Nocardia asteroides]UGT64554.1 CoA ester lyase [Nocardia asteroides]